MELTDEMKRAFELIESTNTCLFITGKAGTGKTTLLKYIVENTHKKVIVAASTGIAAINAGGETLHRLFNIPLELTGPDTPIKQRLYKDKPKLFRELETLIIDEASMVRPDVLDFVDNMLKLYRVSLEPFGGVQIVLIGDLFQLPPVVKKKEDEVLKMWYRGHHFFYSRALRQAGAQIIELTNVFRQHDSRFINILNHIREYDLLPMDMDDLAELRDNRKSKQYDNKAIHICSLRRDAENINNQMLGTPTDTYTGVFEGDFKSNLAPASVNLQLRIGARVMTLTNNFDAGYYNGSMGFVTSLEPECVGVLLDNGKQVTISPFRWTNQEYKVVKGKIQTKEIGSYTQFPLALGWAITIHKSQGLTFDEVVVHCPFVFAPGMLYVALSRCTSMEGITTDFFIGPKSIIIDRELLMFNKITKLNDNRWDVEVYRSYCKNLDFEYLAD